MEIRRSIRLLDSDRGLLAEFVLKYPPIGGNYHASPVAQCLRQA